MNPWSGHKPDQHYRDNLHLLRQKIGVKQNVEKEKGSRDVRRASELVGNQAGSSEARVASPPSQAEALNGDDVNHYTESHASSVLEHDPVESEEGKPEVRASLLEPHCTSELAAAASKVEAGSHGHDQSSIESNIAAAADAQLAVTEPTDCAVHAEARHVAAAVVAAVHVIDTPSDPPGPRISSSGAAHTESLRPATVSRAAAPLSLTTLALVQHV